MQRCAIAAALLVIALVSTGCATGGGVLTVTVYQPMKAIHRPVVVPRTPTNFANLRILLRCISDEDHLPPGDANKLCTSLANDFERQGADVETVVPVGRNAEEPEAFDGRKPDLTVEIASKIEHENESLLSAVAAGLTLTMAPIIAEQTFSQRVVVFGRDGSVLVEEVYKERFVEYVGIGVWSLNYLMDWFVRDEEDALSGDAAAKAFSKDFYGQMRQQVFNAKVRSEVLGLTRPSWAKAKRPPAAAAKAAPSTADADKTPPADVDAKAAPQPPPAAPPPPPPPPDEGIEMGVEGGVPAGDALPPPEPMSSP